MNVCVQGLWHLGCVTAAGLASIGHRVTGLDAEHGNVENLSLGKAPLYEPGLDELIQQGIAVGNLRFASSAAEAVMDVEVLWVAYDTPVDDDDRADVDFVLDQVKHVLPSLPVGATVVVSSQMPVGSIQCLEEFAATHLADRDLGFAYSPENLRLGKALDVFLNPDRIIVGTRREQDRQRLEQLLLPLKARIEWMTVESAEMTKHAINAFLATSVTFANEIAALCELAGADAKEVERGLKSEQRIGPKAYLSPGGAFAGGTLARDIIFLNLISKREGLKTPLLAAVKPSNDEHKNWARRRLLASFPDLKGKTIAIWGLTYKPGTDTLRRSLAVELCSWLLDQGAVLRVHDPAVTLLPPDWPERVTRCATPAEAINGAVALIVATEWPEYRDVPSSEILPSAGKLLIIDANRFLANLANVRGVEYAAVGTPRRHAS